MAEQHEIPTIFSPNDLSQSMPSPSKLHGSTYNPLNEYHRGNPMAPASPNNNHNKVPFLQQHYQPPSYRLNMGHMDSYSNQMTNGTNSVHQQIKKHPYEMEFFPQDGIYANKLPLTPSANMINASEDGNSRDKTPRPLQGVAASLKTIERYRMGEIHNGIPTRTPSSITVDFPEQPVLLTSDIYEGSQAGWQTTWRPEQIEKAYSEIYIRDQKSGKDIKRNINEFRRHADSTAINALNNTQNSLPQGAPVMMGSDEVWYAKDIPIMHMSSCLSSKKNRNCMGCSTFWKSVQNIQEDLRPWGNADILVYEPERTETFCGYISMNGSFSTQQREMVACDAVNTLFYAEDTNAVAIWGFVHPSEVFKLTEEDCLGIQFYDQKLFVDPQFLEKKVKVTYAVQHPGQTILIPSMWAHWVVRAGRGLSFSASWNILRLRRIADARRMVELNRSLGLYRPINLSTIVIASAMTKLDEFECTEVASERETISDFLARVLPILKTLILEEILTERVSLSSVLVLSYDFINDKLKKNPRKNLTPQIQNELFQVRGTPLQALDQQNPSEDDEETTISCSHCKYILFNTRRSCGVCKGYDLCEPCYVLVGRNHPHKMKKHRKQSIQTLQEHAEAIKGLLEEREFVPVEELHNKEKDREKEREKEREGERERREKERDRDVDYKVERENGNQRSNSTSSNSNSAPVSKKRGLREHKEVKYKSDAEDELKSTKEFLELMSDPTNDSYEEEVIDCVCGNNKDLGFMISCEKCLSWLHGKCVGISKRNEPEQYYCPRCTKKTATPSNKSTPKNFSGEDRARI